MQEGVLPERPPLPGKTWRDSKVLRMVRAETQAQEEAWGTWHRGRKGKAEGRPVSKRPLS